MQDTIEREVTIKASQEAVYTAITDPTQIITWFPDAIEGSLEPGEEPVFTFEGHGKVRIHVMDAKPYEYFSYRWVPGSGSSENDDVLKLQNTLVEFMIETMGEETKVTLKESGFASLPSDVAEEKFNENSGGWEYMLAQLEKKFA
jgi:uncharacterized protein YndB with AHSA1/START domain